MNPTIYTYVPATLKDVVKAAKADWKLVEPFTPKNSRRYGMQYQPFVAMFRTLDTTGQEFFRTHQEAEDSCMDDCSSAGNWGACMRAEGKRTPNPHDAEQLARIYDMVVEPPEVCVQGEFTLLTFKFPAPGEVGDHD